MTSKYDPLGAYLRALTTSEAPMSFSEIEAVIGVPLPPKAVNHPAWWSNNTSNNTMTKVWLDAGFRTERVDISGRRLVFCRASAAQQQIKPKAQSPQHGTEHVAEPRGVLSRVRAALAGTVRVAPGVSLVAPTGEAWDADSA